MGPERAAETIRKALSMGADKAVHLVDDGAARLRTPCRPSHALAKALEHARVRPGRSLGSGGHRRPACRVMPALLAERLGLPQLYRRPQGRRRRRHGPIERQTETATTSSRRSTPAVVSVVEKINEPRYPSFKGIMAAKKKPLRRCRVADAGIDAGQVGLASAPSQVVEFATTPPRAGRARSSRTRATAARRSPSSSRPRSSSEEEADDHG